MAVHARIALKSDQEPILVDSLKNIQGWSAERNDQTTATSQHRLVHDSKLHAFVKDLGPELRADFMNPTLVLERTFGQKLAKLDRKFFFDF